MRRAGGAFAFAAATAVGACGSTSTKESAPPRDAGAPDRDAASEAGTCSNGDVYCDGTCQEESVNACSASCTLCPQPASSHGAADCLGSQCLFSCDGGYARCATQSCCGTQTIGDVVAIEAAGDTSCGVTTDGAVWCWGDDSEYVLGGGSPGDISMLPVQIVGLPATSQVAMGAHHVCALLTDDTVACWGADEENQLGDGQTISRAMPAPAGALSSIAAVTAGNLFTCALAKSGDVSCWGSNSFGQIGVPSGAATVTVPTQVQGLSSAATAIAAGGTFVCALVSGGDVECWGDGNDGELGGTSSGYKPVKVSLPSAATAIAAGTGHVCAVVSMGTVVCWGSGGANQLGSAQPSSQPTPVAVPGVTGATAVAAGGDETCVVDQAGAVTCWGGDPIGDQGLGPAGPAQIPSLAGGIANIGVASGHACATTTGHAPKCWGSNDSGDLGDDTLTPSWAPIDVMDF